MKIIDRRGWGARGTLGFLFETRSFVSQLKCERERGRGMLWSNYIIMRQHRAKESRTFRFLQSTANLSLAIDSLAFYVITATQMSIDSIRYAEHAAATIYRVIREKGMPCIDRL